MKVKQKAIMIGTAFILLAGLTSMVFSATLQNDMVLAQAADPCQGLEDYELLECRRTQNSGSIASEEEEPPECEPGEPGCCGGVRTSIIGGDLCKGEGEEGGVIFGLLKAVLTILTAGVGIAAVGGIAYGALLYTTAENKPDQTKKAIGIITNVVIGIIAYALMFIFLNFLIPGGILT